MSNTKQNLTNCADALSAAADALLEAINGIEEMEHQIMDLNTRLTKAEELKKKMVQLLLEDNG